MGSQHLRVIQLLFEGFLMFKDSEPFRVRF